MNQVAKPRSVRRATNVTLPEDLVREARERGVSVSRACEEGLGEAVAAAKREAWLREARPGIEAWNRSIAENGLPLAEFRPF